MKVYVIRQEGVYWHEIIEIHSDMAKAIDRCKFLSKLDIDSYHDWVVSEFTVNNQINELKFNGCVETSNSEREIYVTNKDKTIKSEK